VSQAAARALEPELVVDVETAADAAACDALVDAAFGPGRFAKTAERLRERNAAIPDLCFVAREDERVIGTVRLWPITIGGRPATFLGPIAVDADCRRSGVGAMLVERACAAAKAAGWPAVLLVGDAPYFGRFGFVRARGPVLPGPVDPARLLILPFEGGVEDFVGSVRAG
jgi:predicted N-acetyltransferase YhbS